MKRGRANVLTQQKQIKTMNSLTQSTQSQKTTQDKAAAVFDVSLSLPPATTDLNSEYFQEYLKEVAKTGNVPF